MNDIKVKVKAQAYEKSRLPTKLSELENDLDIVTKDQLICTINALKQWMINNFPIPQHGRPDLYGGEADTTEWVRQVFGGTSSTTEYGVSFKGGSAKD